MQYANYNDYFEPLNEFITSVFNDSPVCHRDLDVADHSVRITSSYAPLIDALMPAIEHLSSNTSVDISDFTIFLVDLSKTKNGFFPEQVYL